MEESPKAWIAFVSSLIPRPSGTDPAVTLLLKDPGVGGCYSRPAGQTTQPL